jgi:hypothetical protein
MGCLHRTAVVCVLLLEKVACLIVTGILEIIHALTVSVVIPAGDPVAVGVVLVGFYDAIGIGDCFWSILSVIGVLKKDACVLGDDQLRVFGWIAVIAGTDLCVVTLGLFICSPENNTVIGGRRLDPFTG